MKSFKRLFTIIAVSAAMFFFNPVTSWSLTAFKAGTYAELTTAVTNAADGDIINITNNIVISAAISISKTITIYGNNFTISVPVPGLDDEGIFAASPSAFRVFTITGATKTIILNDMTIKGGANISGAGINVTSATVKLNNVIICDCYGGASNGGGGVYNSSGKLFFNNVQLIRNAARYGGGFVNAGGTMFIENSSFSENRSTYSVGGGGGGENNSSGVIYMNNSTFSNNKSTEIGGGINNYNATLWISNSSFTGNVGYGATTCGGAIGINGGTANIINCIFAYNYIRNGGTYTNPTSYALSDISKYSGSGTLNSYYNIYHSSVTTNVSISDIAFGGNATGSDNTMFTNGLLTKLTDGTGAVLGTGEVFQPFLISLGHTGAITLQTSSFALQPANLGTQTGFYNNNGTSPIVGYYNGSSWVTLTGANAQNYQVTLDQFGTTRANPPVRGSVEVVVNDAYMLKINKASNGTVNGGSLYGDIYASGTQVSLFAIPNTGYTFTRWDYVVGGSGTASTTNPYDITVDRNITLIPVFTASAAGNYTIIYIGNGNTGGDPPATGMYSSSTTISGKGNLSNDGYAFSGWNTNDNGSGTNYAPGATYSNGTNLTLYAKWTPMNIWTAGAHNDNWNNTSNWSENTVPVSNKDVFIPTNPSGGNIFPSVNIASAACQSITIAAGASISIPSGNTLSVYGNMDNSGSSNLGLGTLVFAGSSSQASSGNNNFYNLTINNSNGVSFTGTNTLSNILKLTSGTMTLSSGTFTLLSSSSRTAIISSTGTGSISGNITIQRYLGASGGYYYVSSPLTTGKFSDIADNITITGYGKTYKNGGWSNVWKYNETDISQIQHPDGVRMNGWEAPASADENMNPMQGIAVYTGNNITLDFTGTPNIGAKSISVYNTSSVGAGGSSSDDGWNFVGNPYPCSIDWEAAGGWTKTNLDNALYSYEPSSRDGGTYKSFVNGIGIQGSVTGVIAPMQGFFIHAYSNGTLGMNNNVRVDNTTAHFYKKTETKELLKLKVSNLITPDKSDETVVYFQDGATQAFNRELDAYKLMNTDNALPNLYVRSADNKMLSIYALPLNNTDEVIPLTMKTTTNGTYRLEASEISNFAQNTGIYLINLQNNAIQDLRKNPAYIFDINEQQSAGKEFSFYIKFKKAAASGVDGQDGDNLFFTAVQSNTLSLTYHNSLNHPASIQVFNALGQQAATELSVSNGTYKFNLEHGIYIVRMITNNKTYT